MDLITLMNALKYHWWETSNLSGFEACGVQRFHPQEVCARDWFCNLPRIKKYMALFISKFFHILLHQLLQHVDHKWVIRGSHPDCSMGQWVHFQPCYIASTCAAGNDVAMARNLQLWIFVDFIQNLFKSWLDFW